MSLGFTQVYNLHQPPGNLEALLGRDPQAAKEILWALDRIPRSLWPYEEKARVHLAPSGSLLETLSDPRFQQEVYGIVKCEDLLWHLQNTRILSILATGYYHPLFPVIPRRDWAEHVDRWRTLARHLFWRMDFPGFWPPELAMVPEMIPVLRSFGIRYVVVDPSEVAPVDDLSPEELRYRPHRAQLRGEEITVIVRDEKLSRKLGEGMPGPRLQETLERLSTQFSFPALVTVTADGDSAPAFRDPRDDHNYWTATHTPLIEAVVNGQTPVVPTFIEDFLDAHPPETEVQLLNAREGASDEKGFDVGNWTRTPAHQHALERIHETSRRFHEIRRSVGQWPEIPETAHDQLRTAKQFLLRAETSCHLFWGEAWLQRCEADLAAVDEALLGLNRRTLGATTT